MQYNSIFQWLLDRGLFKAAIILFAFGLVMWAFSMGILWLILKKFG